MSADITTVVITRDRRDQLLGTLARHRDPVIVIDNGSVDGTASAVREHFPAVRVVRPGRNLGAAGRNLGARLATTPYVAFADDDSWWEHDSLDQAAHVMEGWPTIGLLAARVLVEPEGREDSFNAVLGSSPLGCSPLGGSPAPPGTPILGFMACAAVVRRDAFLAVGGFEGLLAVGGEEQLLAWDLADAGWDLRYDSRLTVHHEPLPSPGRGAARRAALWRSAVLVALMRRSWTDVLRQTRAALASSSGRSGVGSALVQLPRALRRRRRMSARLRAQVSLLER